jgi:ADP-ribosylglycohydrolase
MEQINELKQLNALCSKYFGMPATYVKYKLDEFDGRMKSIESVMHEMQALIGASALRVAAVSECLESNSLVTDDQINKFAEKIIHKHENIKQKLIGYGALN